jgi:hypothetical protein
VHSSNLNKSRQDVTPRPRSPSFPFPSNQLALLPSRAVEPSTQSSEHSISPIPHLVTATLAGVDVLSDNLELGPQHSHVTRALDVGQDEVAPMSDAIQMVPVSEKENLDATCEGEENSVKLSIGNEAGHHCSECAHRRAFIAMMQAKLGSVAFWHCEPPLISYVDHLRLAGLQHPRKVQWKSSLSIAHQYPLRILNWPDSIPPPL